MGKEEKAGDCRQKRDKWAYRMEQNGIGWNRVWNGMVKRFILDQIFEEN